MLGRAMLVLAALLLSGCAGAQVRPLESEVPRATHGQDNGGIEGVVVDPEFRPIGGARLQIIGVPKMVNSTGDGRFAFSDLPPETYLMIVNAIGFFETKQAVTVPGGNVTQVRVVLQPVPPPVPYIDTSYNFNGVIRYGYAYYAAGQRGNFSGVAPSTYPEAMRSIHQSMIQPRSDWRSLLLEVDWEPASDQSDQLALQLRYYYKGGFGQPWVTGGDPPLRWGLERERFEEMRKNMPELDFSSNLGLQIVVTTAADESATADVGLYLEQRFAVLGAVGYNAPLPPGYSRLAPP